MSKFRTFSGLRLTRKTRYAVLGDREQWLFVVTFRGDCRVEKRENATNLTKSLFEHFVQALTVYFPQFRNFKVKLSVFKLSLETQLEQN